jgi:hypothetical protein
MEILNFVLMPTKKILQETADCRKNRAQTQQEYGVNWGKSGVTTSRLISLPDVKWMS